jgi:glycosyltransferase involved in cell wall biosynthesis
MEKIICTLINNTSDVYNHEILVLDKFTDASNWIRDKRIRFVDFEKPTGQLRFFRALRCALKESRPDLLMTYNWGATDAIWLGRIAGMKHVIHSEHGFNADEGRTTIWKRDAVRFLVYRLASKLVVVSREFEGLLQRRYLLGAGRVVRIPNGIDPSFYSPDCNERRWIRKVLGFADSDVVVGFSGRLDPIKNLGWLLEVFASCVRQHSYLRLLVVGDGPERKRLERLSKQKNLQGHIVLTGQQGNVVTYLRAMDVFLLTSLREQMPMSVLEAMAVGIPVVATKVGEIPYMIDNGRNGFVLDVGTPLGAFGQTLSRLLCPARRKSMGEAARQKVIDHFQEQTMVQRYKTVIRELE